MTTKAVHGAVRGARLVKAVPPSATHQPAAAPAVSIVGAHTFLQGFKPLETIIDGLPVPRGGVVCITGKTGSGKTTISALLQVSLRLGLNFAGREVTAGSVLVLAGENPDDYAMHLMATVQALGISPGDLSSSVDSTGLWVIPGTFDILSKLEHINEVMGNSTENLVAVFVDTSAAFFTGVDENDNVGMLRHASLLRELSTLPGKPTVFVLCHPTKNPTKENLLPRGGVAFLNEVDANLTAWNEGGVITLHHCGKIRGATFDPIRFELQSVELAGHLDCRGRPIFSTAAKHLPDERAEQVEAKALDDENRLLIAMQRKPGGSIADLAMAAGMTTGGGVPHKSKVSRLLNALFAEGLVKKSRTGAWTLTAKGKTAADELP